MCNGWFVSSKELAWKIREGKARVQWQGTERALFCKVSCRAVNLVVYVAWLCCSMVQKNHRPPICAQPVLPFIEARRWAMNGKTCHPNPSWNRVSIISVSPAVKQLSKSHNSAHKCRMKRTVVDLLFIVICFEMFLNKYHDFQRPGNLLFIDKSRSSCSSQ